MPLGLFGGLFNGLFGMISQHMANTANAKMQQETNKHNQQMQQEANQAQMAQHELAYKRSSATNQVALMQNAGMSKAGALNALSGGGVYQPAPISASTDQAPQMDNSGTLQALQMMAQASANYAQRQDEMKRFNESNQIAVDEAERQRQHEIALQREKNSHEEKMKDKDLSQQLDIFNKQFQQQVDQFNESVRQWKYLQEEDKRRWQYFAEDQLKKLKADVRTQEAIANELSAKSSYMAEKWRKLFEYSDSDGTAVEQDVQAMVADWKKRSRDEQMDDYKAIDEMVDSLGLKPEIANLLKFALKTALKGLWLRAQKAK